MHREVHSEIPFLMYASCNKFTRHDMQDMLQHIYTTWAQSSELCERGYLMSPGTDGDPRRAAAHCGGMQLSQTLDVRGVDCNVACWGGKFFDPPHLFKNSRSHGLNHGFQLESGMRVTVATVRPLAHVIQCQILDRAYDPKDKQNVPLAIAFLQLFKSIGDAACSLGGRDLTPTLPAAIPDVRLTGQLFDLLVL